MEKSLGSSFAQFRASGAQLVLAIFTLSKWREIHQNMSFASNMVDWARSLQKNLQKVSLHSFVHPVHNPDQVRTCRFNIGKIARNAPKHDFCVQYG